MRVHWLEQTETDVPFGVEWLNASELSRLQGMHVPKRQKDWRLGRWTAKCAVAGWLKLGSDAEVLHRIEVRARASGAPELFYKGEHVSVAVSLSHSSGVAMCALAPHAPALGCDIEKIEQRSDAFFSVFFTAEEQEMVARAAVSDRPLIGTLIWSAKESALKALGEGLRLDTRCVLVDLGQAKFGASFDGTRSKNKTWHELRVLHEHGSVFSGWWQDAEGFVRTVVTYPQPAEPVRIISLAPPLYV